MRRIISTAGAAALVLELALSSSSAQAAPHQTDAAPAETFYTLGTGGGPIPHATRAQPANLLMIGGDAILIDVGDGATKLDVPANISIIALPAKCPGLNALLSEVEGPVENIWQFMRDNWLSNRVFTSHENIIDHCCEAWNKLIDQPWRIMTIGRRKWARGS